MGQERVLTEEQKAVLQAITAIITNGGVLVCPFCDGPASLVNHEEHCARYKAIVGELVSLGVLQKMQLEVKPPKSHEEEQVDLVEEIVEILRDRTQDPIEGLAVLKAVKARIYAEFKLQLSPHEYEAWKQDVETVVGHVSDDELVVTICEDLIEQGWEDVNAGITH